MSAVVADRRDSYDLASSRGETHPQRGHLIVNADDWGWNREVTDRTVECIDARAVSSVSAMVFMEDSARAAAIARGRGIDTGLHLNLTTAFSASGLPVRLLEQQQRLTRYLCRYRFAQAVFHPGLVDSFEYVVSSQLDEFGRLYGDRPSRIDGHHHMHLCANVVLGKLLPAGTIVRRNFSFQPGEKSWLNRLYRSTVDRLLAQRHRMADFFFSLPPPESLDHLKRICALARSFTVEVETHPTRPDEYKFLTEGKILRWAADVAVSPGYAAVVTGS